MIVDGSSPKVHGSPRRYLFEPAPCFGEGGDAAGGEDLAVDIGEDEAAAGRGEVADGGKGGVHGGSAEVVGDAFQHEDAGGGGVVAGGADASIRSSRWKSTGTNVTGCNRPPPGLARRARLSACVAGWSTSNTASSASAGRRWARVSCPAPRMTIWLAVRAASLTRSSMSRVRATAEGESWSGDVVVERLDDPAHRVEACRGEHEPPWQRDECRRQRIVEQPIGVVRLESSVDGHQLGGAAGAGWIRCRRPIGERHLHKSKYISYASGSTQ